MIGIAKACTVVLMRARDSLVVRCREKDVNQKKKKKKNTQKIVKMYLFKALANKLWLTLKNCFTWFTVLRTDEHKLLVMAESI